MDFIVPVNSSGNYPGQQNLPTANCFAQAQAFALGQNESQIRGDLESKGLAPAEIERLIPHKVHPGNHPSSILMFPRLGPRTLGKLVAMYEHKVFVQSVIWGINPFDQWGVELGKKLADSLAPAVANPDAATNIDPAVQALLGYVNKWRS